MAVSETPRHKLRKYGAGTDPHPTRTVFNTEVDKLEGLPAISQGSTGARPLSGVGKVLYWDESVKRFVYDDGTSWQDVAPIGGANPAAVAVSGASKEGVSVRAARADHVHPLPYATALAGGAMRATDKEKLDAATPSAVAETVVMRNASGVFSVGTPYAGTHSATKAYVDARMAAGMATIMITELNVEASVYVPLPAGQFTTPPIVTLGPVGRHTEPPYLIGVTKTGFTIWTTRNKLGAADVNWIAAAA